MENNIANNQKENIESYNRLESYVPKEYAFLDRTRSWKKCRCGRVVPMFDSWCGGCGQKLEIPDFND